MQDVRNLNATPRHADRSVCMKWVFRAWSKVLLTRETYDYLVLRIHFADSVKELAGLVASLPPLLDAEDLTNEELTSVFCTTSVTPNAPAPRQSFVRFHRWWNDRFGSEQPVNDGWLRSGSHGSL